MRIAYVTESFPPDVNGVAHTAVRVVEQLARRGHEMLVIAPEPARALSEFLESAYAAGANAGKWDRSSLERP